MNTELKTLTDEQLIEYHRAYSKLTARERSRHLSGLDNKKGYHIVRLLQQAEMVLTTGDLVLDEEGNRELMKSVRRGEWTLEELETWFKRRTSELETLYIDSDLRYSPDESKLKELLFQCLEAHFGSLSAYFNLEGSERVAQDKLKRIRDIINE